MIEKQGVIFDYPSLRHSGDQAKRTRMTAFVGNFLIVFSVLGFAATFAPMLFYETSFRLKEIMGSLFFERAKRIEKSNSSRQARTISFETDSKTTEKILVPKDTSFNILIPKLGLNEKVFANVDVSNEDQYNPILQKGAAHAKGTYFPGQDGNIYIFAHSGENFWDGIKFNNIFYLLKDLKPKDKIVVFFNNKRYNYIVEKSEITNSSNTSFITSAKTGKEKLILQTCWPPLTTWNRLLVFAKPI